MSQVGIYARYTIEEHKHLVEVWPQLAVGLVVRDTYEEASDAALLAVSKALTAQRPIPMAKWLYHPHKAQSDDPMDLFGSWGVKFEEEEPDEETA